MFRRASTRKPKINNQKSKIRGAVAAELALLVVFVYVPLTIGAIYIAWLALARERVHGATHYALLSEGDQSEDLGVRGDVAERFFREFTGDVAVHESRAEEPEIPGPTEVRDLFEEYVRTVHWHTETFVPEQIIPVRPPAASGGFTLGGGGITYEEHTSPKVEFRTVPAHTVVSEGSYHVHPKEYREVTQLRLLGDQIPERLTDHLVDYLRRLRAHAYYRHRWIHDDTDVVAGSHPVRAWNLQVPSPSVAGRDPWHPEAAVRGHKVRMARDQAPPGATLRNELGLPSALPGYEADRDLMHPK